MLAEIRWYLHEIDESSQVRALVTEGEIHIDSLTPRVVTVHHPLRDHPVIKAVLVCPDFFPRQSGMSDSKITMFADSTSKRALTYA